MCRQPAVATTRTRLVLAAFALLVVGAACSGGDGESAGRLTVDGRAEVADSGGEVDVERGSRSVKYGERVKVLEGTAVLRLSDDRLLELRAGTNVVLQEVDDGGGRAAQPLLLEKDLLVQAPAGTRLTVSTEGTDVVVSGGAQVSRGPVLVVSSYDGVVQLRSGDQSATVAALREVTVPQGGALAAGQSPLSYNSDDAWDRRFLSDAIELGNELEARSTGFSAQLAPTEGHTVEFLQRLLPGLAAQPEFGATLFDARSPAGRVAGRRRHCPGGHPRHVHRPVDRHLRLPRRRRPMGPGRPRPGRDPCPAAGGGRRRRRPWAPDLRTRPPARRFGRRRPPHAGRHRLGRLRLRLRWIGHGWVGWVRIGRVRVGRHHAGRCFHGSGTDDGADHRASQRRSAQHRDPAARQHHQRPGRHPGRPVGRPGRLLTPVPDFGTAKA